MVGTQGIDESIWCICVVAHAFDFTSLMQLHLETTHNILGIKCYQITPVSSSVQCICLGSQARQAEAHVNAQDLLRQQLARLDELCMRLQRLQHLLAGLVSLSLKHTFPEQSLREVGCARAALLTLRRKPATQRLSPLAKRFTIILT